MSYNGKVNNGRVLADFGEMVEQRVANPEQAAGADQGGGGAVAAARHPAAGHQLPQLLRHHSQGRTPQIPAENALPDPPPQGK